jgi:hypothetical protein
MLARDSHQLPNLLLSSNPYIFAYLRYLKYLMYLLYLMYLMYLVYLCIFSFFF